MNSNYTINLMCVTCYLIFMMCYISLIKWLHDFCDALYVPILHIYCTVSMMCIAHQSCKVITRLLWCALYVNFAHQLHGFYETSLHVISVNYRMTSAMCPNINSAHPLHSFYDVRGMLTAYSNYRTSVMCATHQPWISITWFLWCALCAYLAWQLCDFCNQR